MDTPARESGGLRARFSCGVCGELAGRAWLATPGDAVSGTSGSALQALLELDVLERPENQGALVVDTFFGVTTQPVSSERIEWVVHAIADTDDAALYRMGYAYAPFHCPDCPASYCGEHWSWREFDDEPLSGIEGNCPFGHFHVLAH